MSKNPLSNLLDHYGLTKLHTPDNFARQLDELGFNFGSGGISYQLLIELFYIGRMLRYFTREQIISVYQRFDKIATQPKFRTLVDRGYLKTIDYSVFQVTDKPKHLIDAVGLRWAALTYGNKLAGKGSENEILNTGVLVDQMKDPYFFHYSYLQFPKNPAELVPDALMVLRNGDKYRLIFLEIENTKKGDWENYVNNKQDKYRDLAKKLLAFSAWQILANRLKLYEPKVSEFCFSVRFIGNFDFDTKEEDGFEFR